MISSENFLLSLDSLRFSSSMSLKDELEVRVLRDILLMRELSSLSIFLRWSIIFCGIK